MATKTLLLLLPLLGSLQERPAADDLLKKIDGKNPAASFRAIGDLLSLPLVHRPVIEAGAEKLEGFYRDALRSELKLREDLGELFGKDLRVTLKKKDSLPRALLNDLEAQAGMKLQLQANGAEPPSEPLTVEMENVPALAVLAEICEKAQLIAQAVPGSPDISFYQGRNSPRPFWYRNFAFFPTTPWKRKRIDFSGPSPWTVSVSLNAVTDTGLAVAGWKPQARVIEAVTEKGVKLEVAPPEPSGSVRRQNEEVSEEEGAGTYLSFAVRLADGAGEKIARVRFVATAILARSTREYHLTPAKPKAEDDDFEITLQETKVSEGNPYPVSIILLKPKRMKPAELATLPLRFQPRFKEFGDTNNSVGHKVKENAVEYQMTSYPQNGVVPQPGGFTATLEDLKISVPLGLVERPVYVEMTDIPLK